MAEELRGFSTGLSMAKESVAKGFSEDRKQLYHVGLGSAHPSVMTYFPAFPLRWQCSRSWDATKSICNGPAAFHSGREQGGRQPGGKFKITRHKDINENHPFSQPPWFYKLSEGESGFARIVEELNSLEGDCPERANWTERKVRRTPQFHEPVGTGVCPNPALPRTVSTMETTAHTSLPLM